MGYETKMAELLRIARQGTLRARELDEAAIPRAYLRRLCDRGELVRVARGVYRIPEAPITELHTVAEVAKRVPRAVMCLLTALEIHELTTEAPHAIWIQIDRKDRAPSLTKPKLEIVRASGPAREHGVETRIVEGVPVRLTTAAKTVADCFRYRRRVGLEVAIEALRDYLRKTPGRKRVGTIDALIEAAMADRVYNLMRPYIEALA
jgi:predicted transcriptional regulator of viral defense system